ncbi:methionyl-tRNA formyltransferase, partial [Chloroflexota bacterium]
GLATAWNLPVMQPDSLRSVEAVAQLAALRPDVIIVAAYGQILPKAVLDIPTYGCINVHPSLLPKCRGASPVAATILAGDEFAGVSIMLMDEGMDTGPVLVQAQIPISPQDTTGSLTYKLSSLGARLLQETLVRWLRQEIKPRPQPEAGVTYCGQIRKEDSEIDWNQSAEKLWQRLRAFNPWPGSVTRWRGKQLKILAGVPLSAGEGSGVGRVVAVAQGKAAFGVGTGDGVLGVTLVQLEGKRAITAAEFLRGQQGFVGSVLPS